MTSYRELKAADRIRQYRQDLELYATENLQIRDKQGQIRPFPGFNSAQKYVHGKLEAQLKEHGWVRAIILKGRQQGISTYIAARYYHKSTLFRGIQVYILAHEQSASDSLFKMVDRYQIYNPLAPHVGASNVKELEFDKLESSYHVATAGQRGGGRSKTISLFHGSEVAFWQNAADHFASSVQTVPMLPGTEIILESTGNGASGEFYERWQKAVAGEGDYIPIFVPWYWQEEYKRAPGPNFELSGEAGDTGMSEREYAKLFDLSDEQMAWRRAKVSELGSVQLFDQEYPATSEMAFAAADLQRSFIKPIHVLRARKRKGIHPVGPLILGIDPSGPGKDRFTIGARQGPAVLWVEKRQMPEVPEAVEWIRHIIDRERPDRAFIDLGYNGKAIYDYLRLKGEPYKTILKGVNFGGVSQFKMATPKKPGPKNRRAEMWDRSRVWLESEEGVSIPDEPSLQADATAPRVKHNIVNNDFLLESKDEMKARGVRSPDEWDCVALTFAEIERILASETRDSAQRRVRQAYAARPGVSRQDFSPTPLLSPDAWMG